MDPRVKPEDDVGENALDGMYPKGYIFAMNTFEKSDEFEKWFMALKDMKAKARILARLLSAEKGNFGDCAPVGNGVSEMRIHHGPGYRVYYTRRGDVIYLLLVGGDKSTQKRDIKRALAMAEMLGKDKL